MVSRFHLAPGIKNSLTAQLKSALAALSAGNMTAANDFLQSFIDHVNAQSGKQLTGFQARSLAAAATQIRAVIK